MWGVWGRRFLAEGGLPDCGIPEEAKEKNIQKHVQYYYSNNVRIIPWNVPLRKSVNGIFMSRHRRKCYTPEYNISIFNSTKDAAGKNGSYVSRTFGTFLTVPVLRTFFPFLVRRYIQHAHFIPLIVGVRKRGAY